MIAVKVIWNGEEGEALDDLPVSYYGGFDSLSDAISWIESDLEEEYEGEYVDAVADHFRLSRKIVNRPDSIYGDIPDEDIRVEDPSDVG